MIKRNLEHPEVKATRYRADRGGVAHMILDTRHDTIPEWVFKDPSGKAPFTKGTIHMDKEDMNMAMDMYYEEMAWDKKTGIPTVTTYQKLGLGKVADELSKKGLLP